MQEEKILELLRNEDFLKKLASLEEAQEVVNLFAGYDITLSLEDVQKIRTQIEHRLEHSEELDENDLENIAGGMGSGDFFGTIADAFVSLGEMVHDLTRGRW